MSTRPPLPPTGDHGADESGRPDLAESLKALREATNRLADSATPAPEPPDETPRSARSVDASPMSDEDAEAQIYYERLEQAGQLADVSSDAEIRGLSPRVTHVRLPDGSIRRIGYSIR